VGLIKANTVVFLHTRNRPEFVMRAIKSFRLISQAPVIILDASDEIDLKRLKDLIERQGIQLGEIHLVHHSGEESISERFYTAIEMSSSNFVYLMADDDLVMPGFTNLVKFLNSNPDAVAAYGETFSFQIREGFVPFGELDFFKEGKPNPEAAWLEDDSVQDRLLELSKRPLSTLGWYALHRRTSFEELVRVALSKNCSQIDFEFILNVMQPVMGRVIKLQQPCLARQANQKGYLRVNKRILDYARYSEPLIGVVTEKLQNDYKINSDFARRLVLQALEKDKAELENFSWRQIQIVNKLLGRYPLLNSIIARLRKKVQTRFTAPDFRFQVASETSHSIAHRFVLGCISPLDLTIESNYR
jgi:glycosyltransferase domain-containing protein